MLAFRFPTARPSGSRSDRDYTWGRLEALERALFQEVLILLRHIGNTKSSTLTVVTIFVLVALCRIASRAEDSLNEAVVAPLPLPVSQAPDFKVMPKVSPSLGAASCAASSCHGGPKPSVSSPTAARGSEYSLWLEHDPHARSWSTMSSELSNRILTKLSILKDGKIVREAEFQNCLACHNTPSAVNLATHRPALAEGVGCEACHGSAERWIDSHFNGLPAVELGMTDFRSLLQRADQCVKCHVGTTDRDMNHDIIAAGHPALYFDMAVYYEKLPKHWRDDRIDTSDLRSRLWLAGQVAMTKAELSLMETRAEKKHAVSVWPELATYACTDCHQTLSGLPRAAKPSDRELLSLGKAAPRRWNIGGVEALALYLGKDGSELLSKLEQLKITLQKQSSNTKEIAAQARSLRLAIENPTTSLLDSNFQDWNQARQRMAGREYLAEPDVADKWESAARFYLAAWAGRTSYESTAGLETLRTLRRGLLFLSNSQSPGFPRPDKTDQPPTREEWQAALQQAAITLVEKDSP